MKSQISGDTEFEAFVQQIEDGQEAVALQNPYTDIQLVTIAKNLIEITGFYMMDWREWNRTDKAQKTWVEFKLQFFSAFRENRDQSRQAQHAGYGQSNTQNSANAAMLAEMTQDHRYALENLSTATQSDRATVENMSKTIADLTLQLGQENMKLTEAQSSIATLTSKLAKTGTIPNRSNTSPNGPNNRLQKDGYCWSHGYKITKGHSSSNCENKKSGHMTADTRSDTMGGKLYNKGWDKWRRVCDK